MAKHESDDTAAGPEAAQPSSLESASGIVESSAAEPYLLRESSDTQRMEDWALVLAAAALPYRLDRSSSPWQLACLPQDVAAATAALDAYDRERADEELEAREGASGPARDYGATQLGASIATLLLGFHAWLHRAEGDMALWYSRGTSSSEGLLRGQWWRSITALTLHADLAHVVGNVAVGLLVFNGVAHWVGPAWAAWSILLVGALGNGAAATYRYRFPDEAHPVYASIGASTATFGAVGLLVGLQIIARRPLPSMSRRPRWMVFGAGLAIFATLGVGPNADIAAHVGGLGVGTLVGLALGRLCPRAPQRSLFQPLLAALALGVVALAWLAALHGGMAHIGAGFGGQNTR